MTANQLRGIAWREGFKVVISGKEAKLVRIRPGAVLKDRTRWLFVRHRDLFVNPEPETATPEELELCARHQAWLEVHFGPVTAMAVQRESGKRILISSNTTSSG